jgi:hypothetical protein
VTAGGQPTSAFADPLAAAEQAPARPRCRFPAERTSGRWRPARCRLSPNPAARSVSLDTSASQISESDVRQFSSSSRPGARSRSRRLPLSPPRVCSPDRRRLTRHLGRCAVRAGKAAVSLRRTHRRSRFVRCASQRRRRSDCRSRIGKRKCRAGEARSDASACSAADRRQTGCSLLLLRPESDRRERHHAWFSVRAAQSGDSSALPGRATKSGRPGLVTALRLTVGDPVQPQPVASEVTGVGAPT